MPGSSSNLKQRLRSGASFVFPDEIPMDRRHFLDQSTSAFQGIKDGLPELIKNSKDQYARLGVQDRALRQIVVIADSEDHRLAVIDFAGAYGSEFAGWAEWANRHANRKEMSLEIEGGHGNGGKSFMVRGARESAFIESCFDGERTKMGFRSDDEDAMYKPGWAYEGGTQINGVAEKDPAARLKGFLKQIDLSPANLPPSALKAFEARQAFTGVLLFDVTEWANRQRKTLAKLPETLPALIASHGQTALTIETCDVWVIVDGQLVTEGPIAPAKIEPQPGFEKPLEFPIPDVLPDPEGDSVDMTKGPAGLRILRLQTSLKQMQLSEDTKARNVIRLWNERNNVANWPLQALGIPMASVGFIYGELRLPALFGDQLSGIERGRLNNTPLTRALEHWAKEKVRDLADELRKAMMDETKPQDRKQAKSALEGIRELMRQFLDTDQAGVEGSNKDGTTGGGGTGTTYYRNPTDWGTRLDEIVFEGGRDQLALALATTIPLSYSGIEKQPDGKTKPVRVTGVTLKSDDASIVTDDGKFNLTAASAGTCNLWLETASGQKSNVVKCDVFEATDVSVDPPEEPLLQGQRVKLAVKFDTASGQRADALIDASVDEPGMGQVGRSGRFVAGGKEGPVTVRIRFGKEAKEQKTFVFQIGPDRVTPPDTNGGRGSDIPEILFCGDPAPGKEELPEDQRTMLGGESMPTIIEDPILFPNVVWINPNSKEAMRVRSQRGGPTGKSGISSKHFIQFLALKCFDILKRLFVRQGFKGKSMTEFQYIQQMASAEMECAGFIDAAWEVTETLVKKAEEADAIQAQ